MSAGAAEHVSACLDEQIRGEAAKLLAWADAELVCGDELGGDLAAVVGALVFERDQLAVELLDLRAHLLAAAEVIPAAAWLASSGIASACGRLRAMAERLRGEAEKQETQEGTQDHGNG